MDLFGPDSADEEREDGAASASGTPLADRMRPDSLGEIVGQEDLLGPGRPLRSVIENDRVHSMILWGPPGSGKTTLARLIARLTRSRFVSYSAVLSGIREIREVMQAADRYRRSAKHRTLLFIDELHRFNKAQQDAFLPYVEQGVITLIGATTQNPSFEVNAALLSRCSVYVLRSLTVDEIIVILRRALSDPRGLASAHAKLDDKVLTLLASFCGGDARRALNVLEQVVVAAQPDGEGRRRVAQDAVEQALQRAPLLYDRTGDAHFDLISALHKSLRNSDADAALYWLTRMLESGEDPLYCARRMVRFASEDIGNAAPQALTIALAAKEAFEFLGDPEGRLALLQAAAYLAAAPKSNAVYEAYGLIRDDLRSGSADPVPMELRNAPTRLMKHLGHGRGYEYAHHFEEGTTSMECLPERLRGRRYYRPRQVGYETELARRLETIQLTRRRMRENRRGTTKTTPPPTRSPQT
ncbi:MAG: replication-associated recombination protein A [Acidobacteria bacterium]|nr:replication-associated recombination protein A [Acidobacteriota bacterium]